MSIASPSSLEALAKALANENVPDKHRVREHISTAFDVLEQSLKKKIPVERVVEIFNAQFNAQLSVATFRRLLREQRGLRAKIPHAVASAAEGAQ